MPEEKQLTRLQKIGVSILKKVTGFDAASVLSSTLRATTSRDLFGKEDIDPADLVFGLKREPACHRVTFGVANDAWDNGFEIKNTTDPKDTKFNEYIQKELKRLNARGKLTLLTTFERLFGWAILVLRYSDYGGELSSPVDSPAAISEIEPYCQLHVGSVEEDTKRDSERKGLPEYYVFGTSQENMKVHFSRTIHLATRIFDHPWKGISAAGVVYDDMMSMRYIRWSLAMAMIRYGSGFPDVELLDADDAKVDAFIASGQFDNLNARKYFVHNERQRLEFKGVGTQALDPSKYLQPSMEAVSTGTGIPEPVLKGAQAGAITGSEINERAYFKMVSDVQTAHEPMLRDLINRIAGVSDEYSATLPDYEIVWKPGFESDERTKAEIELLKAQAGEKMLAYMTPDEVRLRLFQMEELPNQEGASLRKVQPQLTPGDPGQEEEEPVPEMDQAQTQVEADLTMSLKKIVTECVEGRMPQEDGILSARLLIESHVQRMKQISLLNVRALTGKPIGTLSPERERQFLVMTDKYVDSFKRILADAMKGRPQ